jgi:cyclic pyranopterin phosphate synthase
MENLATHLRLSVTDRCNIQCFYCHHEGQVCSGEDMSLKTILSIVKDMATLGVKHVKITGGEPLVRPDIVEIVKGIKANPEIIDLSMTTNGLLLEKLAKPLKEAGLHRINIGCDSIYSDMVPKTFSKILPGIKSASDAGLIPIKVNVVILKGINDSEIPEMIDYARKYQFILQLIELIPMGVEKFDQYYVSLRDVEKELEQQAVHIHTRSLQARKQYDLGGVIQT